MVDGHVPAGLWLITPQSVGQAPGAYCRRDSCFPSLTAGDPQTTGQVDSVTPAPLGCLPPLSG